MAKSTIPIEDYLPDGPIKDLGQSYLDSLPDVQKDPLSPESFFQQSDSTWADYALAYALLYPYAVLFLAAVVTWLIYLVRKWKSEREITCKEACSNCGALLYRCALNCPRCGVIHPDPLGLDFLGFTQKNKPAVPGHEYRLRRFKRCHFCGDYIREPRIMQQCSSCCTEIFESKSELLNYDRYVQKRRWQVYGSVVVISWLPIIGPLIASFLYRRVLVIPYGSYMKFGPEKLLIGILSIFRFLFRYVPFIGIIGMPILAVVENHVFRKIFLTKAEKEL